MADDRKATPTQAEIEAAARAKGVRDTKFLRIPVGDCWLEIDEQLLQMADIVLPGGRERLILREIDRVQKDIAKKTGRPSD